MSDEIFEVATSCTDVAELGQSYIDRVDGERILLPLAREIPVGEGVRFIVHLVDGTPAFAGSGRCVQASDQGDQVPPTDRYETLIDTLAFDERSLPVYEYIVAVRQLAYSDNASPDAGAGDAESVSVALSEETEIYTADVETTVNPEVTVMSEDPALSARDSHESLAPVAAVEALSATASTPAPGIDELREAEPVAAQSAPPPSGRPTPLPQAAPRVQPAAAAAAHEDTLRETPRPVARRVRSEPPSSLLVPRGPMYASVKPEPLPTGILTRPAIAAHWAPAAPRPPQRSLRPSNFQTSRGPLQVPAAPPRPDLDPSLWVTRAERPAA